MKKEQALWNLVREHIPGHFDRVENVASTGMPDVNYCHNGIEVWLELKVADNFAWRMCRKGDLFDFGGEPWIKPTQLVWHYKRVNRGGKVLLLARFNDTLMLFRATRKHGIYVMMDQFQKPWVWQSFTEAMKGISNE